MAAEFGQGDLNDDEFLPDKEQAEIDHQTRAESTISLDVRAKDMLKHNEDVGGTIFKYDLPVENTGITFKSQQALALKDEVLPDTSTENLFSKLECDKDTAFEGFIVKHH